MTIDLKEIIWKERLGNWRAESVVGTLEVRILHDNNWYWRFSDKTAWMECESVEDGRLRAEVYAERYLRSTWSE